MCGFLERWGKWSRKLRTRHLERYPGTEDSYSGTLVESFASCRLWPREGQAHSARRVAERLRGNEPVGSEKKYSGQERSEGRRMIRTGRSWPDRFEG